jgi:hypothetical protein
MITIIAKGHGRIDQRINGIYRSNSKPLPAKGERVSVIIPSLDNIELDAIVCNVNLENRTFDVSMLENLYKVNRLLEKIRKEENLSVKSTDTGNPSSVCSEVSRYA